MDDFRFSEERERKMDDFRFSEERVRFLSFMAALFPFSLSFYLIGNPNPPFL
jgi:hypothetical protein